MFQKPRLKLVDYSAEKHSPNNIAEKLNDLFFVLLVLVKGEERGIPITTGVLIKTLFTSQIDLAKEIKFWHTGFYPYTKGPFNTKFYDYLSELEESGMISKDGYNLSLTTKGSSMIQPLLESAHRTDGQYKVIDNKVEENLQECKNFHKKVNELHKEKLIDETNGGVIIEMQKAIDSYPEYLHKYIESSNDEGVQFTLPSNIINKLLNIETKIDDSDYEDIEILDSSSQLIESLR